MFCYDSATGLCALVTKVPITKSHPETVAGWPEQQTNFSKHTVLVTSCLDWGVVGKSKDNKNKETA